MANILYLFGVGLIAYPWWKWWNEKGDKHMLNDLAERKKMKKKFILLSIGGVILIALGSVL